MFGRGDRLQRPGRICFVPPSPPFVMKREVLGSSGSGNSFETSAVGPPVKVAAPTARSSISLLTTSLGGVDGWGRGSGLSLSFVCVMLDVPLDPMPEWGSVLLVL